MTRYDEFRIFITDGQSPLNSVPTLAYRQPAFCILQKPVCAGNFDITEPSPVEKPLGKATESNPPSAGPTNRCPASFSNVVHLEIERGHYIDLLKVIYAVDGANGETIFRELSELPEDQRPVNVTFNVPSHFKKAEETLYTTDVAGDFAVTFTAEFNGNLACRGIFPITFI